MPTSIKNRTVLYVDAENILYLYQLPPTADDIVALMVRIRELAASHGEVVSAKIIGWHYAFPLPISKLHRAGFTYIDVPTTGKNSADIRLSIEATSDIISDRSITHLAVSSGDNDFAPLAHNARARGLKVVGIMPVRATGRAWANSVDHRHSISNDCGNNRVEQPTPNLENAIGNGINEHVSLPESLIKYFARTLTRYAIQTSSFEEGLSIGYLSRAIQATSDHAIDSGFPSPTREELIEASKMFSTISATDSGGHRLRFLPGRLDAMGVRVPRK